ncbi:MAG: hypothetical protein KC931_04940 [Candidatus Omnitrophica bacterium]|nr:hypothetical protein [Candidatus Omnitrophota bacterium]
MLNTSLRLPIPMILAILSLNPISAQSQQLSASVIAEETIATCLSPNNGAGPMWCYGSPLVVRQGNEVFVSIMETGEGVEPLCNTRWRLFKRDEKGWGLVSAPEEFRLREPSPLVSFEGSPLFLSITPSLEPPGTHYGPCDTQLLRFDLNKLEQVPVIEHPKWEGEPYFTDHSYRGVCSDGRNREILWMNIDAKTSIQHVSHRDSEGNWEYLEGLEFPIRSCYPQVALKDGAAHVLAIGDIVEPIKEWQEYKFEQSGRKWDYVFRRLFYSYTPNIHEASFSEPLEIDTLESTAGHITNLDLWIDPDGKAHVLYLKNTVQSEVMRDRFFPGLPILRTLEYTVLEQGKIVKRETLAVGGEGDHEITPNYGRFHSTPDGRLWAVFPGYKATESGTLARLFLMQVYPEIDREKLVEVELDPLFGGFFTATERGGSLPSWTLDLFGQFGEVLRYAQIELKGAKD